MKILTTPSNPVSSSPSSAPKPPHLIFAGAGTGRTTTITAKIAHMVEKEGIDRSRIRALMFSKEAARNMREKGEKISPKEMDYMVNYPQRQLSGNSR